MMALASPRETFTATYGSSSVNLCIFVRNTGIKKGWSWLIFPNGRYAETPPGKYVRLEEIESGMRVGKVWLVRFGDLTEEIEGVDWDFNQPVLTLQELDRAVRVEEAYFAGTYKHYLYWFWVVAYNMVIRIITL